MAFGRQCSLLENKIARFEETLYDYDKLDENETPPTTKTP